jgi:lipopolysaccharide transport system ATP-binding protein
MSAVIKVENIGKQYRLGVVGTGTLSHDLNRWWARMRGKEDPFLSLGETNDRTKKATSDLVWALQNINFQVNQGDVLGIIGRNGAGKSTLLKILSRTTTPTTGEFKVRGRIASLLEVGTGFHPELSGRENVFLNGAIMGMSKAEITKKFDEIVDFSGVERYIDTPVKRYSSGMYVRLAFAVAAHLEPEILIIDEVLAVGDAEFQKKCIGKMKDVSVKEGRTVLFVSHNMSAVKQLCTRGIILSKGTLAIDAPTISEAIHHYQLLNEANVTNLTEFEGRQGTGQCRVVNIRLSGADGIEKSEFHLGENLAFNIDIQNISGSTLSNLRIVIGVYNAHFEGYLRFDTKSTNTAINLNREFMTVTCRLQDHLTIKPDLYSISVAVFQQDEMVDYAPNSASFAVANYDYFETGKEIENIELAKVMYKHQWDISQP